MSLRVPIKEGELTLDRWNPIVGWAGDREVWETLKTKTLDEKAGQPEGARGCSNPEADREDLTLAEKALDEYQAEGIEGTVPYSEYRARRFRAGMTQGVKHG